MFENFDLIETVMWVLISLIVLGHYILKFDNKALELGFVILASSLLAVVCMEVNDVILAKAGIAAVRTSNGLIQAWADLVKAWEEIIFYYKMEKKAQA